MKLLVFYWTPDNLFLVAENFGLFFKKPLAVLKGLNTFVTPLGVAAPSCQTLPQKLTELL